MSGNNINFNDKRIKISDFYKDKNKKIFNIDGIDVDKILVSKKVSYSKNNSFKYFIGYNDNDIIRPLFVKLPQTTSYIDKFKDKKTKITTTTTMSLMVKDKQLFKNYNKIWEKIESLMRKKFDSKLFYGNDDNKYIKTKIKTFKDNITNFHNKKVPEEKITYKYVYQ